MDPMYSDMAYRGYAAPGRTATLFGQTMGLVALTAGFFAAGAYAGRNLSEGAVIVAWIAAFVVLMIMNFTARRSVAAATVLLVIFAGLTAADFQRLRRSQGLDSAPLIAASIFLDILNVFWFFLRIFSGSRD